MISTFMYRSMFKNKAFESIAIIMIICIYFDHFSFDLSLFVTLFVIQELFILFVLIFILINVFVT